MAVTVWLWSVWVSVHVQYRQSLSGGQAAAVVMTTVPKEVLFIYSPA